MLLQKKLKTTIEITEKCQIVDETDAATEDRLDNCFVAGDTIFIGDFTNAEYELISIFHEIGHRRLPRRFNESVDYNTFLIEMECWQIGIKVAREEYQILFSDDAIAWGLKEKLCSYKGHDERERLGWSEGYGSTLWINRKVK